LDYFDENDEMLANNFGKSTKIISTDPSTLLIDLREHDVSYSMRASIDMDIRVGSWYLVTPTEFGGSGVCTVMWQKEMLVLCQPKILAFDIECEKSPLKFPNADRDRIYMISYMSCGQGFLLINRYYFVIIYIAY
jgi:DNA polymerase epsilon subunit 1